MAGEQENPGNVKLLLAKVFEQSLKLTFPDEPVETLVSACNNDCGDYQCNNAMGMFSRIKGKGTGFNNPISVAQAIIKNLPQTEMIESCSLSAPGFINVKLSMIWLAKSIDKMLRDGIKIWAPKLAIKRAVVDFSSPNIAKEMHVGHLRSTIIGDTLARMLEFSNVDVLRRNHVGDWGTQFGMLIEFLFEMFPQWENEDNIPIEDLQLFYKQSKARFDSDPLFKEKARQAVVSLQGGDSKYRKAWAQICEISRSEFQKVYKLLNVTLEEKGESFYNPYIPDVLEGLNKKGLVKDNEGARVVYVKGKRIPLIVVKRDGGFNYASTDLAALWYRLNKEKADWIIYVTDVGQREHFDMVFEAAKLAGWLPENKKEYPKASHVGFGLVLGDDGKRFRTRSTEVVKLVDLLDEAKNRSKQVLVERGKAAEWGEEELDSTAQVAGYSAVKYADLKNNRQTNYTFSFDHMLNDRGDTAFYLLYAYARISSIIRNSDKDVAKLNQTEAITLDHEHERALGLSLLRFSEVVEESVTNLLPNILCEYLYSLSECCTRFYSKCKVNGSEEEISRLLLCNATSIVMRKCFELLGITPVDRI